MAELEIETNDWEFIMELMGTPNGIQSGSQIKVPGGAILHFRSIIGRKAFDSSKIFEFTLSFGIGVSAGIVANWLYEKLNGRIPKIRINRSEIHINKGEIEKIIVEEIEKQQGRLNVK